MVVNPLSFSAVPDSAELARISRDLRFYPVKNAHPRNLTPEQIDAFNRRGSLQPIPIFSREEIDSIRAGFDELLARVLAEGGNSYSISSAHLKFGRVYDILTDHRIVNCVGDLLGDNVIGWGSHFFCKMPRDGQAVAWHQDASYWPLSPSKVVTVWLAVDDADRENACMKFIAGSHHVGHLTFRESHPDEHNVLNQTVENAEQYGEVVFDELRAGEISLHSDLLLHGSDANDSDRRRCGLTLRYASADVRAGMDWNRKGVWVKGCDHSGHWANQPRPMTD